MLVGFEADSIPFLILFFPLVTFGVEILLILFEESTDWLPPGSKRVKYPSSLLGMHTITLRYHVSELLLEQLFLRATRSYALSMIEVFCCSVDLSIVVNRLGVVFYDKLGLN